MNLRLDHSSNDFLLCYLPSTSRKIKEEDLALESFPRLTPCEPVHVFGEFASVRGKIYVSCEKELFSFLIG